MFLAQYAQIPVDRTYHVRILGGDPLWRETQCACPTTNKTYPRYFWRVVERGKEEEGPKILQCGRQIHLAIIKGVLDNPVPPVLNRGQRVCQWLGNWMPFSWLSRFDGEEPGKIINSLATWTPFRRLLRRVPPSSCCLDDQLGYDFEIRKEMQRCLDYTIPRLVAAGFVPRSRPAGTPEQIRAWKNTDVFLMMKGFDNGDKTDEGRGA